MTILSENIKKPWLKSNMKEINNLIKNQTFLVQNPEKDDPMTPCIDVYKAKIQYYGSLDNFKLIILVRGDL